MIIVNLRDHTVNIPALYFTILWDFIR